MSDRTDTNQIDHNGRPFQDPTALTAIAVAAAKEDLRREFTTAIACKDEVTKARLERVQEQFLNSEKENTRFEKLFDEKHKALIDAIAIQFKVAEDRLVKAELIIDREVEKALESLKEIISLTNVGNAAAVAKSEASMTKEIDALKEAAAVSAKVVDDRISLINGQIANLAGIRAGTSTTISIVAVGLGVIISLISVGWAVTHTSPVQPVAILHDHS